MNQSTSTTSLFQVDEFYLDLQTDGRTISLLSEEKIAERPFPGLRPFKTSEFQLFKGRDGQAQELIERLNENHFLAVIGSSGTGKSSLVRAGLIPQLHGGFLHKAGSSWEIAICRPGQDPIKNLSVALTSVKTKSKSNEILLKENESIEEALRLSPYGIIEVYKKMQAEKTGEQSNLLVIIDQFEELFRYTRNQPAAEGISLNIENDFVQLLLNASAGIEKHIYVIITMRSEFLGDCVRYKGLPEAINKSQYLVPQLTRNQVREVIELPLLRAGKKSAPKLVEILINEIESEKLKENLDQLPILQHALMRSYDKAFKADPPATEMSHEHYKAIGSMSGALAKHADEVFEELGRLSKKNITAETPAPDLLLIAKLVFQALTDSTSDQKGGRRPTKLRTIYGIASVITDSKKAIDYVIDYFRHPDISFIMPPANTTLYPDLMLDISHESLMRNWPELKQWMQEEVDASELYKKLNERREQNDKDPGTWIKGILLRELQDWQKTGLHNAVWAARYQKPDAGKNASVEELYKRNLAYLDLCQQKLEEEEAAIKMAAIKDLEQKQKEKDKELKSKRNRVLALTGLSAALISVLLTAYAFTQKSIANRETENANFQTARALKAQDSIKIALNIAMAAEKEALTARNEALAARDSTKTLAVQNQILMDQKISSAKNKAEILQKNITTIQNLNIDLGKAKDSLTDRLAESQIKDEDFYNALNKEQKTDAITILTPLKFRNPEKYNIIVKAIRLSVEAKENQSVDPNIALLKSNNAIKIDNNKVTQAIEKDILNDNLFYQTKNDLWYDWRKSTFLVANPGTELILVSDSSTSRLEYKNGELFRSNTSNLVHVAGESIVSNSTNLDQYYDSLTNTIYVLRKGYISRFIYINNSYTEKKVLETSFQFNNGVFAADGQSVFLVSEKSDSIIALSLKSQKIIYTVATRDKVSVNQGNMNIIVTKGAELNISCLKVDPYTGHLIVGYANGIIEIRDQTNGNPLKILLAKTGKLTSLITSLDVSANGKIVVLDGLNGIVHIFQNIYNDNKIKKDTITKMGNSFPDFSIPLTKDSIDNKTPKKQNAYSKVSISPDGRQIVALGSSACSVLDLQYMSIRNLQTKISTLLNQSIDNAIFIDNDHLITLNASMIRLWNVNPIYTTNNKIWNDKNSPYLSILNKIENGMMTINGIDSIKEDYPLEEALEDSGTTTGYFTERVLHSLAKISGYKNPVYRIYNSIFLLSTLKEQAEKDSIIDFANNEKVISGLIDSLEIYSTDENALTSFIQESIMMFLYNESGWNNLLLKNFKPALNSLNKAKNIDSTSHSIIKNLALTHLLLKDYNIAETLYLNYKAQKFVGINENFDEEYSYNYYKKLKGTTILFKDIFLIDLDLFEKYKIISPDDPEIIKIRAMLKQ
ncbi:MAG: hypothetical protein QM737_02330 [Ferruginibacter sp.]